MTDLVSRLQAAQLRGNAAPADVGAGGLLDEAAQRIAELEAVLRERIWISVKDRLPERDTPVWLHTIKRDDADGQNDYVVTHWMPIPDPPKEQSDE
jgi:hypothetical protein